MTLVSLVLFTAPSKISPTIATSSLKEYKEIRTIMTLAFIIYQLIQWLNQSWNKSLGNQITKKPSK